MKRFAWAGILVVTLTGGSWANENIAAGKPLALVAKKKVQEELKLTAAQVAAIEKLYAGAAKDERVALGEALARELQPAQLARLKEISYQVRGGSVLVDDEVAKALGLSLTQVRKIGEVWKDKEEDLRQILRITKFKNAAAKRRYILKKRRDAGEELIKLDLLTDGQEAKLKKLQGAPFDLKDLDN